MVSHPSERPQRVKMDATVLTLQKAIAAKRIGKIVLTHLEPDAIPTLKTLVCLINPDGTNPVEIFARSAAIRLLQQSFGAACSGRDAWGLMTCGA